MIKGYKKKYTLIFLVLIIVISTIFLGGCSKNSNLINNVSYLRDNYYVGSSKNFTISAVKGFKESPYVLDGKVEKVTPYLIFKIDNQVTENATYTLTLNYEEKEYVVQFKLNPVTSKLTANITIENFNVNSFNVDISVASQRETITMQSIITSTTIDYNTALNNLLKEQNSYLNSLTDENGNYKFELSVKLLYKEQKPYWYIAIISGEDKIKALLIDGTTGNLLAVREVL